MTRQHVREATPQAVLARELADRLVLAADPAAQSTAWGMWEWCRPAHESLEAELRRRLDKDAVGLLDALAAAPADAKVHRTLTGALADALTADDKLAQALAETAASLRRTARIAMHIGSAPPPQGAAPRSLDELLHAVVPRGPRPVPAAPTEATVVIPFRAGPDDGRARNLAACLAALADQDLPRQNYRIVVVESDGEPRWEARFGELADDYVFAFNPGPFNKAWAVNCGVAHSGGRDALVCVMDGDLLTDRGFLARGIARFQDESLQGHWPYRQVLFADPDSSAHAVDRRCAARLPDVDLAELRGAVLLRTPGGCIWLRRSLFDRISGMDERFEGWGGEDNDFAWRAELYGGLERFDDTLVHLDHARSAPTSPQTARSMDAHPWCTWPADTPYGDLDRYRRTAPTPTPTQ